MHAPHSHRVHPDSRTPSSLGNHNQNHQNTYWGQGAVGGHDEHGLDPSIPHPSPSFSARNSVNTRGRCGSTTSHVHEQATTLEVPVQTVHVETEPEDEQTRQRMLGLLLQQTSEQVRANPDRSTFKIELPEHLRHALRQDTLPSLDIGSNEYSAEATTLRGSLNQSTSYTPAARGYAAGSREDYGYAPQSTQQPQNKSHHTSQPSDDTIGPPSSATATAALLPSSRTNSLGGASVQATPARMYGDWKTREDRRREIEMGKR